MKTYGEVYADLEEIIQANPGFVYKRPPGKDVCQYRIDGKPSCLIGHLLDRWGITDTEEFEGRPVDVVDFGIDVEPKAIEMMQDLQDMQDYGQSWGAAWRNWHEDNPDEED